MLTTIIEKYLNNKNARNILLKEYQKNLEFCGEYAFFSNDIKIGTIKRGVQLLTNIINLQLILNKKIYFPGIGLFSVEPEIIIKNYEFPKIFSQEIQIINKIDKKNCNFIDEIIKNGKIHYQSLDLKTLKVRKINNSALFSIYTKIGSKINYINQKIIENSHLKKAQIKIILTDTYNGNRNFKSIIKDESLHYEDSIMRFIELIDFDGVMFNLKILEDLIYMIGYLENSKKIL